LKRPTIEAAHHLPRSVTEPWRRRICAFWIDSILKASRRPDVEVLGVFFDNLGRNKRLGSFQIFRRRQAARGGTPHWQQDGVEEFIDVSLRQ
jgi:hypothetical protein